MPLWNSIVSRLKLRLKAKLLRQVQSLSVWNKESLLGSNNGDVLDMDPQWSKIQNIQKSNWAVEQNKEENAQPENQRTKAFSRKLY